MKYKNEKFGKKNAAKELSLTIKPRRCNDILEMSYVLNCHFYDFSLLDASPALFQIFRRNKSGQIREAVVHPIPSPFLYYPVGHWILKKKKKYVFIRENLRKQRN